MTPLPGKHYFSNPQKIWEESKKNPIEYHNVSEWEEQDGKRIYNSYYISQTNMWKGYKVVKISNKRGVPEHIKIFKGDNLIHDNLIL